MNAFGLSGCCCTQPCDCTFLDDTFTRSDSTDLGDSWNEVAGDWEISTNRIRIASANAVLVNTIVDCEGYVERITYEDVRFSANGDKARFIICYVDDDNYVFAEVTAGTAQRHYIYQRVAGVETALVESSLATVAINTNLDFTICVREGRVRFTRNGSVPNMTTVETSFVATAYGGIGTGATFTGNLTCEQIAMTLIRLTEADSPLCAQCSTCDWDTEDCGTSDAREEYDLTVPGGFTPDNDANCTDGTFSGTFTLSLKPRSATCRWVYDFSAGGFDYHYELVQTCTVQTVYLLAGDSDASEPGTGATLFIWELDPVADRDGPNTLDLTFEDGVSCTAWPTTVEVEAA